MAAGFGAGYPRGGGGGACHADKVGHTCPHAPSRPLRSRQKERRRGSRATRGTCFYTQNILTPQGCKTAAQTDRTHVCMHAPCGHAALCACMHAPCGTMCMHACPMWHHVHACMLGQEGRGAMAASRLLLPLLRMVGLRRHPPLAAASAGAGRAGARGPGRVSMPGRPHASGTTCGCHMQHMCPRAVLW